MQLTEAPLHQSQCISASVHQWSRINVSMDHQRMIASMSHGDNPPTVVGGWWPSGFLATVVGGPVCWSQDLSGNESVNELTDRSETEWRRPRNHRSNPNFHVIPQLAVGVCCRWANLKEKSCPRHVQFIFLFMYVVKWCGRGAPLCMVCYDNIWYYTISHGITITLHC